MKKTLILVVMLFLSIPTVSAQRDYYLEGSPVEFISNSILFRIHHFHTQNSFQEKCSVRDFIATYFYIANDTFYVNFPKIFLCYGYDESLCNGMDLGNKMMIEVIEISYINFIYQESSPISFFKNSLIGKGPIPIAPANKCTVVNLYL